MLIGKKFPENVRALRLLLEELLRPIFSKATVHNIDVLGETLEDLSQRSHTVKMWIDCFVTPMLNAKHLQVC